MNSGTNQIDTVRVELGARSYDIVIGRGLIDRAGAILSPVLATPRVIVVSDDQVGPLYSAPLVASMERAGIKTALVSVPAGEECKSFAGFERLVDALLASHPDRQMTIIALGGGVVGDLAGFAAASLLSGVDFIQVPTTLLAQVDSSVGGKTGINTRQGKNLVGAFHQPRMVLADIATLDSLPERHLRSGYAETVKYGLIDDAEFFAWLETHGADIIAGDPQARRYAIAASCRAKARIVADDEREAGSRALLNLGHTFGHALERAAGYGERLLHGEAVGIGLVLAFALSARLGFCSPDEPERIATHLRQLGLLSSPRDIPQGSPDAETLLGHMGFDKKVKGGRIRFVLARGIGRSFIAEDVPLDEARAVLESALGDSGRLARHKTA
jgi:3-dehydroquinate synthase